MPEYLIYFNQQWVGVFGTLFEHHYINNFGHQPFGTGIDGCRSIL